MFNYSQIYSNLTKDLNQRQKEVIFRRFGLNNSLKKETLESIGKSYGVTRERIRQIEEDAINKMREKIKGYREVFDYFASQLKKSGGLKKEEEFLGILGKKNFYNQISFLLTLDKKFIRIPETRDYFSFWTRSPDYLTLFQQVIDFLRDKLKKDNHPVAFARLEEYVNSFSKIKKRRITKPQLTSIIEISKEILKNADGLFGLRDWPEINPRGIRDKAYLVFKKENRPLHFIEVSRLISKPIFGWKAGSVNYQSVHNELIKDPRFVLVGRGTYGLKEWGYMPGAVKDIILSILKNSKESLSKKEIIKEVSKQRLVKENTILLNLSNKRYFLKTPEGKYTIREI